jgi:hypothetical protein
LPLALLSFQDCIDRLAGLGAEASPTELLWEGHGYSSALTDLIGTTLLFRSRAL